MTTIPTMLHKTKSYVDSLSDGKIDLSINPEPDAFCDDWEEIPTRDELAPAQRDALERLRQR